MISRSFYHDDCHDAIINTRLYPTMEKNVILGAQPIDNTKVQTKWKQNSDSGQVVVWNA